MWPFAMLHARSESFILNLCVSEGVFVQPEVDAIAQFFYFLMNIEKCALVILFKQRANLLPCDLLWLFGPSLWRSVHGSLA